MATLYDSCMQNVNGLVVTRKVSERSWPKDSYKNKMARVVMLCNSNVYHV